MPPAVAGPGPIRLDTGVDRSAPLWQVRSRVADPSQQQLKGRVLRYPLLILLFLLVVDKIALVPSLRDAGRKPPTPIENLREAIHRTRSDAARDPRPEIVVLGTSRTKVFQYLHSDTIRRDPYLNQARRSKLLGLRFETGTILPAADMLVQYVYAKEYLSADTRPRLLVLEVSPSAFNRNSNNNLELFMQGNVFDYELLLKLVGIVQPDRWPLIGTKVLFASYAYGFRPENAMRNLLRGRTYRDSARMAVDMILLLPRTKVIPPDYDDQPEEPLHTELYRTRIVAYTDYVQGMYLRRFALDMAEVKLLDRILTTAQKVGQPIVLWQPRSHPFLARRSKELGLEAAFAPVEELIRSRGVAYYDASRDTSFSCRRHRDASHQSARCMPYLMDRIIAVAESHYPDLLKPKKSATPVPTGR